MWRQTLEQILDLNTAKTDRLTGDIWSHRSRRWCSFLGSAVREHLQYLSVVSLSCRRLKSAVGALLLLFLSTELESRKWTIWRPNICFLFLRSAFRTSAFHKNPCFCMFFYYHIYPRFAVIFKFRTVNNALLCFQISNSEQLGDLRSLLGLSQGDLFALD
jgi:hypothetical protein